MPSWERKNIDPSSLARFPTPPSLARSAARDHSAAPRDQVEGVTTRLPLDRSLDRSGSTFQRVGREIAGPVAGRDRDSRATLERARRLGSENPKERGVGHQAPLRKMGVFFSNLKRLYITLGFQRMPFVESRAAG